jgi:hypothetical protein
MRIEAPFCSFAEEMNEGISPIFFAHVTCDIPRRVEQWMRIPSLCGSPVYEMRERIEAAGCDVGIDFDIPLHIKQRMWIAHFSGAHFDKVFQG